jgi:hypothetical protein
MERPITTNYPCLTSIQHDSDLGTPNQPKSHHSSFTKITKANANLKTIHAARVPFNDPKVVDVLTGPDEVGTEFVKTIKD